MSSTSSSSVASMAEMLSDESNSSCNSNSASEYTIQRVHQYFPCLKSGSDEDDDDERLKAATNYLNCATSSFSDDLVCDPNSPSMVPILQISSMIEPTDTKPTAKKGKHLLRGNRTKSGSGSGNRRAKNSSNKTSSFELPEFDEAMLSLSTALFALPAKSEPNLTKASLAALLHTITKELGKVKRFLSFRTNGRFKSSSSSSITSSSSQQQLSPKKFKADMINDYNENMSKLLENRLLILQLLHFECTLLEYLPKMLLGEGIDIGHGGELSIVRLQELFRSYYLIMNKLCYESTFIKVIIRLHRQTPTNAATMLLLLFRVLAQQTGQTINSHQDEEGDDDGDDGDEKDVNMVNTVVLDDVADEWLDEDVASPHGACSPTQLPPTTATAESEELSPKRDELHKKRMKKKKKKSLTTSDKGLIAPMSDNKTLVVMLNYLQCLVENELFCSYELSKTTDKRKSSSSGGQTSNDSNAEYWNKLSALSKEAASSKGTSNTLPKTVSLVAVCHEILSFFCQKTKEQEQHHSFQLKSAVRQHAIETLAHLCFTKNGLHDVISLGSTLLQTILCLLWNFLQAHNKLVEAEDSRHCAPASPPAATAATKSGAFSVMLWEHINKPSLSYVLVLRNMYSLLSILITLSEFKQGIEFLLFHHVANSLVHNFLVPLVNTLSGGERVDPDYLQNKTASTCQPQHIDDIGQAYRRLRVYNRENYKVRHYLDRIVAISSIIVQRLLPPKVLPLDDASRMVLTFKLPTLQGNKSDLWDVQPELIDESTNDAEETEIFKRFDSDLDDDDGDEDDDDDDDEDSEDEGYLLPEVADEFAADNSASSFESPLFMFGKATEDEASNEPFTEDEENTSEQENQDQLVDSYLKFFPEIRDFGWTCAEGGQESGLLGCKCDNNVDGVAKRHQARLQRQQATSLKIDDNDIRSICRLFDWSRAYQEAYSQTRSVLPRLSMPKSELNFVNDIEARNESGQPFTYPFLDARTRAKSYHHIKLTDYVRQRLELDKENETLQVVYDIEASAGGQDASVGGQYLRFDSRFECGNLRKALVVVPPQKETKTDEEDEEVYLLLLNYDVNTTGHMQWYNFSVEGMQPGRRYRFKMINCEKKSVLYNSGQQPLIYSNVDFQQSGKMWQRLSTFTGRTEAVSYYRNHYVRKMPTTQMFRGGADNKPLYTLEFTAIFPHANDQCYFAYNIPYSFSFLRANIAYWVYIVDEFNRRLEAANDVYFSVQTLGTTLNGNELPVLTISSKRHRQRGNDSRPHYIYLSARVHPAESNSSWILKGVVDFLLHPSADVETERHRQSLLSNYVFKIVPMLNPDGVINGCTRTDLQTNDLNRHWHDPIALLHPTIYHAKLLLKCLSKHSNGRAPVAYVDLHGHSRSKNIFSYSCAPKLSWKKTDRFVSNKRSMLDHLCLCPIKNRSACQLQEHLKLLNVDPSGGGASTAVDHFGLVPTFSTLPVLLHLEQAPAFNLENCTYQVQKDREHTARIVCWREFNISLSYTIECSASGCDSGPYAGQHLTINRLEEMGHFLARAFDRLDFLYCSGRHVPIVLWPKQENAPGKADKEVVVKESLKNFLGKCVSNRRKLKGRALKSMRRLVQHYPDLKMLPDLSD